MGDLTENFSRSEFRCPCSNPACPGLRINIQLVERLQLLRDFIGCPIHVLSGFRCREHNKRVHGKPRSLHLAGQAADIRAIGLPVCDLYDMILTFPPVAQGGVGLYPAHVHVDIGPKRRWVEESY